MPQVSVQGITFIKKWEKFVPTPYVDLAGVWTIGYGTTRINGKPVTKDTPPITEAQATAYLTEHLVSVMQPLVPTIQTFHLNQNQVDALASFVYNLGFGAFINSTLHRSIALKQPITESMFTAWNKARDPHTGKLVEVAGLTRRRREEFQLFSS